MAAAFFNVLADPSRALALSAGTQPAERVHAEVLRAMRDVEVDLAEARPELLTDALAARVQMLVTMGCGESCPLVPGLRRLDWNIPDPKDQAPERVGAIRDEIRARVEQLIASEGWSKRAV